jgi:hypothetical protein
MTDCSYGKYQMAFTLNAIPYTVYAIPYTLYTIQIVHTANARWHLRGFSYTVFKGFSYTVFKGLLINGIIS